MRAIALVALLLISSAATAQTYGSAIVSRVTSIYDGDTFRVDVAEWPSVIGERMPVRIKGIDTPELRGKCRQEVELARQAKQATVAALRGAKEIRLEEIERGKYFRVLARVTVDGRDLGEQLVAAGLARAYDGGKREGWCSSGGQ